MTNKQSNSSYIGMDDGYNTSIAYNERGEAIIRPSRVSIGGASSINFLDKDVNAPQIYKTEGTAFTVNPSISSNTVNDEYPFSGANRVMVQHVLSQIQHRDANKPIALCTGLPIRRFYKSNGEKNETVINKKIASLNKPVTAYVDGEEKQCPSFETNIVMPESLVAIFDLMVEEKRAPNEKRTENPKVKLHKERWNQHIAFVDIGGRTTDIAIWAAGTVERGSFGTENIGMENIRSAVKERVIDDFDLNNIPDELLNDALRTGRIKLAGQHHDVKVHIDEATHITVETIKNHIANILGNKAQLINEVVFLGGGSEKLYHKGLSDIYGHQQLLDDPIVVNARAFYKYLRYMNN